jgi:hypothetical protein
MKCSGFREKRRSALPRVAVALWALGGLLGCPAAGDRPRECLLGVENASSVLGMDGASSVPLGGGQRLFLFGDTLYGTWNADATRDIAAVLESSAMRVRDADAARCFSPAVFAGGARPQDVVRGPPSVVSGPPSVVSGPQERTGEHRVWPRSGYAEGGALVLFFVYVRLDPRAPLGFVVEGSGVATGTVDPIQVDASRAARLPASEPPLGSALLVHGGSAFVYRCAPGESLRGGLFPCVVAQVARSALADVSAYRYFVAGRGFAGTLDEASIVVEGAPEFTVAFNRHLGRFLMVYVEPFSREVSVRTASAPEGPFSEKRALWPCSLPAGAPNAYCYGAKEHEGLGGADDRVIAFTYNTNSTAWRELVEQSELYWPRLVTVDLAERGFPAALGFR